MDVYRRIQAAISASDAAGADHGACGAGDSAPQPLPARLAQGVDIVERTLQLFRPSELAFAFNGGKDSTVVFHLLRAVFARRAARQDSGVPGGAGSGAKFGGVRLVMFHTPDNFPQVEQFVDAAAKTCVLLRMWAVLPAWRARDPVARCAALRCLHRVRG